MKTRDKCWENDLEKYAENKLVFFIYVLNISQRSSLVNRRAIYNFHETYETTFLERSVLEGIINLTAQFLKHRFDRDGEFLFAAGFCRFAKIDACKNTVKLS